LASKYKLSNAIIVLFCAIAQWVNHSIPAWCAGNNFTNLKIIWLCYLYIHMFNSHKRNKNDDEEQLSKTGKPSLLNVKPLQQYL
jgi:hypothetical protein